MHDCGHQHEEQELELGARGNLEPIEFDDVTIAALIELGELIKSVHRDLAAKGYRIECGRIVPPDQDV